MKKIIAGEAFELTEPYTEGHVCTAAEARVLNQVRSENIGNNLRRRIQDLLSESKLDEARALVETTNREYVFNTVAVSARSQKLEPIEREAIRLATDIIKMELGKKGRKIDQVPDTDSPETWAAKLEAETARIAALPAVLETAKRNVAAKQAIANSTL